jgi:hypothetical protein
MYILLAILQNDHNNIYKFKLLPSAIAKITGYLNQPITTALST